MTTQSSSSTIYGENLIAEGSRDFPVRYAVVTTASPWRLVEPLLHHPPAEVILVPNLEMPTLDTLLAKAEPVEAFVGVGAGMAIDAAKYMAWRRGARLFQIPTTTSSNAPFTPSAGVRKAPVRPLGHIIPAAILVDLGLIQQAPRSLNLAGVGDILAAHTALWDWRLAVARGTGPPWDPHWAEIARGWVERVEAATDQIAALTNDGIRQVMQLHEEMGAALVEVGQTSFLAGSEHWWTQDLEHLTGRHFLHGEVVSLGIVIASWIQVNEARRMRDLIEKLGIQYRPYDLGLSVREIKASLETLPEFLGSRHPPYSWLNEFRLSPEAWAGLCRWLNLEPGSPATER